MWENVFKICVRGREYNKDGMVLVVVVSVSLFFCNLWPRCNLVDPTLTDTRFVIICNTHFDVPIFSP